MSDTRENVINAAAQFSEIYSVQGISAFTDEEGNVTDKTRFDIFLRLGGQSLVREVVAENDSEEAIKAAIEAAVGSLRAVQALDSDADTTEVEPVTEKDDEGVVLDQITSLDAFMSNEPPLPSGAKREKPVKKTK